MPEGPYVVAIVLAAGGSSRMGFPKALAPYRGVTFVETILERLAEGGIERRICVVGWRAEEVARVLPPSVEVTNNLEWRRGQLSSLKTGMQALGERAAGFLMCLVDHPLVTAATYRALAWRAGAAPIVLPTHGGRRGHPPLFGREVFAELLAADDEEGAGAVVRRDLGRVLEVPCDDAGVLADVDTPDDLRNLGD